LTGTVAAWLGAELEAQFSVQCVPSDRGFSCACVAGIQQVISATVSIVFMGSSFQSWYPRRYQLKSTSSQGENLVVGMTIGEVARRAELRPSAIRYYEKLGLLRGPRE
jgi:hypothetical protein